MKTFSLSVFLLLFNAGLLLAQAGSPDSTFGVYGTVIANLSSNDLPYGAVIQSDGKIVVVGVAITSNFASTILLRFHPDGLPDSSFGTNGVVKSAFGNIQIRSTAIALQSDGKIVVAGGSSTSNNYDFSALRYFDSGMPDSSFGIGGRVAVNLGNSYEAANAVAIQSDGKILLAGTTYGPSIDIGLVRLNEDGSPDNDFGTEGIVTTGINQEDQAYAVAVQEDGKIVLGGFSSIAAIGDYAVIRYNPDGTLDKNFGNAGTVTTDLTNSNKSDLGNCMLLLPGGKILMGGTTNYNLSPSYKSEIGLVQYNEDGSLDESFGNGGISISATGTINFVNALARQADGKIYVAGEATLNNGNKVWSLARVKPDGLLDDGFGVSGVVNTDFSGSTIEYAASVLVQPDSRILVTGGTGQTSNLNIALARYLNDVTSKVSAPSDALPFEVYPNPGDGLFNVKADLPENANVEVSVFDFSGKTVFTRRWTGFGNHAKLLDLRALPRGSYQLRLENDTMTGIKHILISK